jgi:hypothetical protein
VTVVHTSARPTGGCAVPGGADPPSPAAAAALPRVPASLKAGLAPLPPPSQPEGPAGGAGGAAPGASDPASGPARQQFVPPGPPGPIPYNTLLMRNNITEDIYVVASGVEFTRPGYFPGVPGTTPADRWAIRGWYRVVPGALVQVFVTRANKAWYYGQTNNGSYVWGAQGQGGVMVEPRDVPWSAAAGGYVSPFTTQSPPDAGPIQPFYMAQESFTNGLLDPVNMDLVVVINYPQGGP